MPSAVPKIVGMSSRRFWSPPPSFGRLSAVNIRIILRGLAAIEHAVVADHAHMPEPPRLGRRKLGFERARGVLVAPRHHQDEVSRRQNGIKDIPLNQALCLGIEAKKASRSICADRVCSLTPPRRINKGNGRPLADFGFVQSLLLQRVAWR